MREKELCARLLPHVVSTTEDYYTPTSPHPFLDGLSDGGVIFGDLATQPSDNETYRIVEAKGIKDRLGPEDYTKIGIPEEIARDGLLWSISTNIWDVSRNSYKRCLVESANKCYAYWDSSNWTVARVKQGERMSDIPWEDRFSPGTELTDEEVLAVKTTATQTTVLHDIQREYGQQYRRFMTDVKNVAKGTPNEETVRLAFASPEITNVYPSNPYMRNHQNAYQQGQRLVEIVNKIVIGRSFELDSGGLMTANYHLVSIPISREIFKGGENIVYDRSHPPVPANWVEI